jgi:hypothetical protein
VTGKHDKVSTNVYIYNKGDGDQNLLMERA